MVAFSLLQANIDVHVYLHVGWSAALSGVHDRATLLVVVHHAREAIVGHQHDLFATLVFGHQKVGWFDVAVGNVALVHMHYTTDHLET